MVAIHISDKIQFKKKKRRHYIIKGSLREKDITVANVYATSIKAPKHKANSDSTEGRNWTTIQ